MIRILIYLCSFLISISLSGQDIFGPQNIIVEAETQLPLFVFSADIDSDGDMDVLSASEVDDKIVWYENEDGLGNFGKQNIISTQADGVQSIYAVDIDGDGDMDVLSASRYDDKIAWYENENGEGNFSPQKIISTQISWGISVFSTDLDGDGDMDVLSASRYDDKIAWYENLDGLGNFSGQNIITTNANFATSVYAADIDNDGDMDVLSSSSIDDKIAWYENEDGLGNFGPQNIITTLTNQAEFVNAADIDNDGDMDVLSASSYNGTIAWYENTNGQGNFSEQKVIATSQMAAVYAADMDNDGDMDVLALLSFNNRVNWYENEDGLGDFGSANSITNQAVTPVSAFVVDIDGDGNMDVLSASKNDNKIAWYKNEDGLGNFGEQRLISASRARGANEVHAVDIDADGDLDVLSASITDDKIAWYENSDGLGTFDEQIIISNQADGATSVYAADIDSDGDMDVLSASLWDGKIAWYENQDGLGSFSEQKIISTQPVEGAVAVITADIDGDGDIDVLSASRWSNKVAWYENEDGLGNFGQENIITTIANSSSSSIHVADVDGDGDIDVLSASAWDNKVAWYENLDGLGNFSNQKIITTQASNVRAVHTSDLDSDGDLDVLVAVNWNNNRVSWYENLDGLGSFSGERIISDQTVSANAVYGADLDLDGDMDVVSASALNSDRIIWYENEDGLANFSDEKIITTDVKGSISIYLADMDNDGDMDLFSSSDNDDKIAWYENLLTIVSATKIVKPTFVQVYPNPFTDHTTVALQQIPENVKLVLQLRDMTGKLLENYSITSNTNLSIRGSDLVSGIYFYELIREDTNEILDSGKLVKQ